MTQKTLDEAWKSYENVLDKCDNGKSSSVRKISSSMKDICRHFFYLGAGFTAMNFEKQASGMYLELAEYFNKPGEVNNFFRENVKDGPKN